MKELKDYLHLYLGAKVRYKDDVWVLSYVSRPYKTNNTTIISLDLRPEFKSYREIAHISESFTDLSTIKLILRPLSDMTEDEKKLYFGDWGKKAIRTKDFSELYVLPQTFLELLSKHFDLFGLIEAGLAIDKNKINNHD